VCLLRVGLDYRRLLLNDCGRRFFLASQVKPANRIQKSNRYGNWGYKPDEEAPDGGQGYNVYV